MNRDFPKRPATPGCQIVHGFTTRTSTRLRGRLAQFIALCLAL